MARNIKIFNIFKVVSRIKSDPLKCEMLVVSEEDVEWYTEHDIPVDMKLPNIIRVCKEVGLSL